MSRFPLAAVVGLVTILAAASPAAAQQADSGQAQLAKAVEGRTAGDPVNCIPLSAIRATRIIDRTAILYDTGARLYVNIPSGAQWLDDDAILLTRTFSGDLCNLEIVTLLDRSTHTQRGSVGLGKFVPYVRTPRDEDRP